MKTLILAAAAVAFATSLSCAAHAASTSPVTYSSSVLKTMIREAHTPQQFQILAAYFRSQQQYFQQQAATEKMELDSLSANTGGPAAKYPRPIDSARNRYEYLASKADQMGAKADHYESLAGDQQ